MIVALPLVVTQGVCLLLYLYTFVIGSSTASNDAADGADSVGDSI